MGYPLKKRRSVVESVPAPTRGLNTVDPAGNLDPGFASVMLNWFAGDASLKQREGYAEWVTGLVNPVKTIIPYAAPSGVSQLLAVTDDGIYDCTATGEQIFYADTIHLLTSGRLSYVQVTNTGSTWLVACNGVDPSFLYDGNGSGGFTNLVYEATPVNPGDIAGVNPDLFSVVRVHQKRLWFIEKNSLTAWYLDVDAVSGTATAFYLGGVFKRGGYLKDIFTFSVDSGEGMDDLLMFLSSEGEIAGYSGIDPNDAETWRLEATHYLSPPRTDRTTVSLGGDVLVLSSYGVMSVRDVISASGRQLSSRVSLSRNIAPTITEELNSRGVTANWEPIIHPTRQALIVAFPEVDDDGVQYVMNLETQAWSKYDLPAVTFGLMDGVLYFGTTDGRVCRFGDIYSDNVPLAGGAGTAIDTNLKQAYNYFESRGVNKHYNLIRLLWNPIYSPSYIIDISTDYIPKGAFDLRTLPAATAYDYWNEGEWNEAYWGSDNAQLFHWDGLEGLGYCASLLLRTTSKKFIELTAADWAYENGDSL